jgi:hypothetical protein
MNFIASLVFFIVITALLSAGIALAAKGSFILLLIGIAVFGGLFVKFGCLDQH